MRFRPYSSPEFPNDNHRLHLGASWVCLTPTGQPRAVMRAHQPEAAELVPLTPLPPRAVEPTPPTVGATPSTRIPLPPASVVQSLLQRSRDGLGFSICVPDPQLFSEWDRPAATDELHLTSAPGPLLSQLLERFDDLSFAATELEEPSPATHRSAVATLDAQPGHEELVPPVLEAEASVPPPVAELIENLPPSTPMNEGQRFDDDRALNAELFEVLKTLEIIDSETEFAPLDAPPSGVHSTPVLGRSAVDDLADAVAEALCAEFAAAAEPLDAAHPASDVQLPAATLGSRPGQDGQAPDADGAPHCDPQLAPDHYAEFVNALCDVALRAGATRAAAVLPRLMEGKLVDSSALADDVVDCLHQAGIASLRGSCLEPSDAFKANASAWQQVLRGTSDDLSACGDTLDGFAACLLGALLGPQSDAKQLRRDLRRRGVAAFGMLYVAD
ncbi:MAG: hypothetical protein KC766_36365 [Myxococcales bacterium]|nr:hypothetical protein [Myxococcales bacterium]